ncbi:hypothetical protein ABWW58_02390 [Sporolactobacillus sp. STCC-11]|uniref:hypothetical protein n=1 Tax=Sporolactobacillus caesalpiniae TaxID=3230362 RepID=UPI00339B2641
MGIDTIPKYKVEYIKDLLSEAYSYAQRAYAKVAETSEPDYLSASTFTTEANTFFISAKSFYMHYPDLAHYEFEGTFESFKNFNFEILQTITKRDENTSWLYSRNEDLKSRYDSLSKQLDQLLENITEK